MNIRFILDLKQLKRTLVLGAAPYAPSTCQKGKLIEWRICENGKIRLLQTSIFPSINNFCGCNLTFMIQPHFLPCIENAGPSPGGVMGNLLQEVLKLMNFRSSFKWALRTSDSVKHLNEHNLNMVMNLFPRVPTIEHKDRFCFAQCMKIDNGNYAIIVKMLQANMCITNFYLIYFKLQC